MATILRGQRYKVVRQKEKARARSRSDQPADLGYVSAAHLAQTRWTELGGDRKQEILFNSTCIVFQRGDDHENTLFRLIPCFVLLCLSSPQLMTGKKGSPESPRRMGKGRKKDWEGEVRLALGEDNRQGGHAGRSKGPEQGENQRRVEPSVERRRK